MKLQCIDLVLQWKLHYRCLISKILRLQSNNIIADLRSKCILYTIEQLLFKDLSLFMFRQIKGLNPAVFQDILVQSRSQYNTRSKSNIISKRCSNTFSQQSITFCGKAYWAKVSVTQDTAISVPAFSNRLRKLLSNNNTKK